MKKLLSKKSFSLQNLDIRNLSPSTFQRSNLYADKIEEKWNDLVLEKQKSGVSIWNTQLYRFEGLYFEKNNPILNVSSINTKDVLLFQQYKSKCLESPHSWPLNMFVASLTKTVDGFYIVGEMSGKTLRKKGRRDLVGGALSCPEIKLNKGQDILEHLLTEYKEEIGILPSDVHSSQFLCLVQSEAFSVGVILEATLSITAQEVRKRFEGPHDDELSGVVALAPNDFNSFLDQSTSYLSLLGSFVK